MRKTGYWATGVVLTLLSLMYMITYIDRVNIATAAIDVRKELGLTPGNYGDIFAAFGVTYALFQIIGGFVGDRYGPRLTLGICGFIWAVSTILTGLASGYWTFIVARLALGLGEGATFPTATRAMSNWLPAGWRGFGQGITHTFARGGNALAPLLVVNLIALWSWRGSFIVLGIVSLVWVVAWVLYFRDDPRRHPAVSDSERASLPAYRGGSRSPGDAVPWAQLVPRMMPTTIVYFCYGWTLWLYLSWIPQYLQHAQNLDIKKAAFFSSAVFIAGMVGDTLGGLVTDGVYRLTGNLATARRNVIFGSLIASLIFLVPVLFTENIGVIAACLAAAFFCLELTIGPIWSVPMDIAPNHSGTASGIMNTGSAVAAIASPWVFGHVIDWTGSWNLPFAGSIVLLLAGALLTFRMRPELAIDETAPAKTTPRAVRAT